MDAVPITRVTTVIQGLEKLKFGFPLATLELLQQLQKSDVMEFQATHNSGGTVCVKMSFTEANVNFEIEATDGNSLVIDEGVGWECMVNQVTSDIYHHTMPTYLSEADLKPAIVPDNVQGAGPDPQQLAVSEGVQESVPQSESGMKTEALMADLEIKEEPTEPVIDPVADSQEVKPPPFEYVALADSDGKVDLSTAICYMTQVDGDNMETEDQGEQCVGGEVNQLVDPAGDTLTSGTMQYVEGELVAAVTQDGETLVITENRSENPGSGLLEGLVRELPNVEIASEEKQGPHKIPRIVEDVIAFCCYVCTRKYVAVEKLQSHVNRVHKVNFEAEKVVSVVMKNAYICFLCNQVCPHFDAMKKHLQRVHRTGDTYRDNRKVGDPGVAGVQCKICLREFVNPPGLYSHTKKMHSGDPMYTEAMHHVQDMRVLHRKRVSKLNLTCPLCEGSFNGRLLFRHINRDHPDVENKEELINQCYRTYHKTSKRIWPVRQPLQKRSAKCPKCSISMLKRNLQRHIRLCTGKLKNQINPVNCPQCNKKVSGNFLSRHMKERCGGDGKHIFMCECKEYFKTIASFKQHLRRAHGENPMPATTPSGEDVIYGCGQCNPTVCFSSMEALDAHSRQVHLGMALGESSENDEIMTENTVVDTGIADQDGTASLMQMPTQDGAEVASTVVQLVQPLQVLDGVLVAPSTVPLTLEYGMPAETETITNADVPKERDSDSKPASKPKRKTYAKKIEILKEKMGTEEHSVALPQLSGTKSPSKTAVTTDVQKRKTGQWVHTEDGILRWKSTAPSTKPSKEIPGPIVKIPFTDTSSQPESSTQGLCISEGSAVLRGSSEKVTVTLTGKLDAMPNRWQIQGENYPVVTDASPSTDTNPTTASSSNQTSLLVLKKRIPSEDTAIQVSNRPHCIINVGNSDVASLKKVLKPKSKPQILVGSDPNVTSYLSPPPSQKSRNSDVASLKKVLKPKSKPHMFVGSDSKVTGSLSPPPSQKSGNSDVASLKKVLVPKPKPQIHVGSDSNATGRLSSPPMQERTLPKAVVKLVRLSESPSTNKMKTPQTTTNQKNNSSATPRLLTVVPPKRRTSQVQSPPIKTPVPTSKTILPGKQPLLKPEHQEHERKQIKPDYQEQERKNVLHQGQKRKEVKPEYQEQERKKVKPDHQERECTKVKPSPQEQERKEVQAGFKDSDVGPQRRSSRQRKPKSWGPFQVSEHGV